MIGVSADSEKTNDICAVRGVTHECVISFFRSVLAPPHADCGYECPENDFTRDIASPRRGMRPAFDQVGIWRYTPAWKMLPTCGVVELSRVFSDSETRAGTGDEGRTYGR